MTTYTSPWRNQARKVVARVLAEMSGKPEREIRQALEEAYPFGPREYWPYKVWLDEIRRQRGTWKPAKPRKKKGVVHKINPDNKDQERMF